MSTSPPVPAAASPSEPGPESLIEQQRQELLALLRRPPRGAADRQRRQLGDLIADLERIRPADLGAAGALELLEGVWELRWSSSSQLYLSVGSLVENLQILLPSQGRAVNLLRLAGPLAPLASIVVEAAICLDPADRARADSANQQRLQVRFQRGGWLGPKLGGVQPQLLRRLQQSFPAWLDITVLDDELRICRGNAGTVFALLRRPDLRLDELLPPAWLS